MKKIFIVLLFVFIGIQNIHAAPFFPNSLVVVRIGDGANPLTSAAFQVVLDEYSTAGVLIQSIPLPIVVSAPNNRLVLSGSSTSEGFLNLSPNGFLLTLGGYDAAVGTLAVGGTTTAVALRVLGLIDASGNINTSTAVDQFSAGTIRSVITVDGSYFYAAGSNSGVRYMVAGAPPSSTVQLSTTPTNNRVVNIFNGQLYVSNAAGTFDGVSTIGVGLPTTAGQTTTILPGFPIAAGPSPYQYSMNGAGTIIYLADDRAVASGGGIQKWTFSAGTWSLTSTLNTGLTAGCRSLAVNWATTSPTLYAVSATSPTTIVTAPDDGATPFTVIATAAPNFVFRGLSFSPLSITPVELGSFTSNVSNNNVNLNWRTENEHNNSMFVVERKSSSSDWSSVGTVSGAGNSNTIRNYSFSDKNIASGNYHYRLNQIDFNGNHKYYDLSNEVIVGVPTAFSLAQNFPNPFNPSTTINYQLPADSKVDLKVFDLSGKEVSTLVNGNQTAGYYSINFNAAGLSSGIYFYRLTANGNNVNYSNTMRMILVK